MKRFLRQRWYAKCRVNPGLLVFEIVKWSCMLAIANSWIDLHQKKKAMGTLIWFVHRTKKNCLQSAYYYFRWWALIASKEDFEPSWSLKSLILFKGRIWFFFDIIFKPKGSPTYCMHEPITYMFWIDHCTLGKSTGKVLILIWNLDWWKWNKNILEPNKMRK